jgi:hypothetical protein
MVFKFFGEKKYFIFLQTEGAFMSLQLDMWKRRGGEYVGNGVLNFSQ